MTEEAKKYVIPKMVVQPYFYSVLVKKNGIKWCRKYIIKDQKVKDK